MRNTRTTTQLHPLKFRGGHAAVSHSHAALLIRSETWNDGCNTCTGDGFTSCTERACFTEGTPFCALSTDGTVCRGPEDCGEGGDGGDGESSCAMGEECGGQVANECGSACPAACDAEDSFCASVCVNGFFCPSGQVRELRRLSHPPPPATYNTSSTLPPASCLALPPAVCARPLSHIQCSPRVAAKRPPSHARQQTWDVGVSSCVSPEDCSVGGGDLPPGLAIGRPFSLPGAFASAVTEERASDWM